MATWPPASLRQRLTDLRELERLLTSLPKGIDPSAETALARYVAVRAAGYIEAVRDDATDLFVTQVALEVVIKRIRSGLRKGEGVSPGQLVAYVGTFHSSWKEELEGIFDADDERLKRSLGSLVAARKKIAHGDGDNVTRKRATEWVTSAEDVGAWIIRRFDPARDTEEPVAHP